MERFRVQREEPVTRVHAEDSKDVHRRGHPGGRPRRCGASLCAAERGVPAAALHAGHRVRHRAGDQAPEHPLDTRGWRHDSARRARRSDDQRVVGVRRDHRLAGL